MIQQEKEPQSLKNGMPQITTTAVRGLDISIKMSKMRIYAKVNR